MDLHRHLRSLALLIFILATYFSTALARHHRIRHNHHRHKRQHTSYLPGNYVLDNEGVGEPETGDWGPWSEPSECSRTCGGGVAHQTRTCASLRPDGAESCTGGHRRYFSCNIPECPDAGSDFRAEQCAEFNSSPFEGRNYEWIPYTKAPNKCELNCMPRGERFYYRHKRKVVDGTRCEEEKLDICVDGKCMPVGCDNMLGSTAREDECRECGGDSSSCNTVRGTLEDNDLQVGYNDILLIPAGATNIRIQEVDKSNNYLAIRNETGHYYLNGNWRIDFPRSLKFAGTTFHYERRPHGFFAPEKVVALGPTTEAIFIVLLYQGVNPGVRYEYSIPEGVAVQRDPNIYSWIHDDFSECSATCGGGVQSRRVTCARRNDMEVVDNALCDPGTEPVKEHPCSTDPCPASWSTGEWGPCSETCGKEGGGFQLRQVYCEKIVANGLPSVADDSECIELVGPKPDAKQPCNEDVECPMWHIGPWKPCDHLCGDGVQRRQVLCFIRVNGKINKLEDSACTDKPEDSMPCMLRPCEGVDWVVSEWSGCEDKCSLTQETRKAHCANQAGKVYPEERCHKKRVPELVRECKSTTCEFQWYAAQWSKCSAQCGEGVQTRKVFCGTFEEDNIKKVDDDKCEEEEKYDASKNCTAKGECTGEWFSGPWSSCSKECGGGVMGRKVVCLLNNTTVDAKNCDPSLTVFSSDPCNNHPCSADQIMPIEPEKVTVSEEEECEEDEDGTFITMDTTLALDKISVTTVSSSTGEGSPSSPGMKEDFLFSSTVDGSSMSSSASMETSSSSGSSLADLTSSGSDLSTASSSSTDDIMLSDSTYETSDSDSSLTTASDELMSTTGVFSDGSTLELDGSGDSTSDPSTNDASNSSPDGASSSSPDDLSSTSPDDTSSTVSDVWESSDSSTMVDPSSDGWTTKTSGSTSSEGSSSSDSNSPSEDTTADTISTSDNTDLTSDTTTDLSTDSTVTESSSSDDGETTSSSDSSSSSEGSTMMTSTSSPFVFIGEVDDEDKAENTIADTTVSPEGSSSESSVGTTQSVDMSTTDSSDGTTESSTDISDMSTTVDSSSVSDSSTVSVDVSMTTDSSESGATTVSGESGATTISAESDGTTVSGESDGSTVSGGSVTTVSGESDGSTVSGESGATSEADDWKTIFSSQSPVELAITKEQKVRKCKPRKPKKDCEKAEFGCCPDGSTQADGPFSKGCPMPMTCNETKHGCCADGVSPAEGPKGKGCPPSLCLESLFGCCQDGIATAEGNDYEGCIVPVVTTEEPGDLVFECKTTEFGCCPDMILSATGPNNAGCYMCEGSGDCDSCQDTKYGCCPDGVKAASDSNHVGCEDEEGSGYGSTTISPDIDCTDSEHGCCPDGKTAAKGINFKDCGVIDTENCTLSYFGCCPNGITPAMGPNFEECRMPCESETFGCCDDGMSPAHGPNLEGCCLNSAYGCCPDNILSAQGPNLEGCGCQYGRYGCCPDNSTVARGPNNEGCGCHHTMHGCCPNRYTPAAGPNFEGCPCYTYQFGCCQDGETIAKGPQNQGCGCENTEFGCCSDERTRALGPEKAGCGCEASKYGCCPNGVSEAQGDKFEGCENVPVIPGESCTEPKDRGSCRDFKVKWFFDMEYGGCSRFWYGGCEGNNNRFNSQDDCKNTCVEPTGRDACHLPKVEGPCEGYYPKWYYDTQRKQCGQFIYGGCLGNNNKFETVEECQGLCVTPETADACEQPKHEGPCQGNFSRWYFDADTKVCQEFAYGGCKSNRNNFLTESSCVQQCLQPGRSRDLCALPREVGKCNERLPKWFFDASENRCMPFYYTGCEGNANRFDSQEACMGDCPPKVVQDTCTLPALVGECRNYTERWYYDSYEIRCRQFYYGGCGGNPNNFPSLHDCQTRCENGYATEPPASVFQQSSCFLPDDHGPCTESKAQWFYDSRDGVCKQFLYGGCQGNDNRFGTRQDCEQRCGNVQDVCNLPVVVGPCSGTYQQYYYDRGTDSCYPFDYGGCQGNANKFNEQRQCEERCKKGPTLTTVRPDSLIATPDSRANEVIPSDICRTRVDPGPCNENVAAWFYDERSRQCQSFMYGGCGGNANRFDSEEQCERQCGDFVGKDVCNVPRETGTCRGYFRKYYFDQSSGTCQEFAYGGCGGNSNRFSTIEECESICLHREEPLPRGNDTSISHQAVCRLPVEQGPCASGTYKRWYYDEYQGTCIPFIYTGCAGNLNRFKSFKSCLEFCTDTPSEPERQPEPEREPQPEEPRQTERPINEIDVDGPPTKVETSCRAALDECNRLRCPYGIERYVDRENCERCRCHDVCKDHYCPDGTQCSVDLYQNPESRTTEFRAVCRPVVKPGQCPVIAPGSSNCVRECNSDADCLGVDKCCLHECGSSCVSMPTENDRFTTLAPRPVDPYNRQGVEPPRIVVTEPVVQAEEGNYATLRCVARGYPNPTVTWKKGTVMIDGSGGRHKLLLDGSLQVIGLYRTDAGTYLCVADNGIGQPAQREVRLDVTDAVPKPAEIIGEPNTYVVVTMGIPASLQCYAIGSPRPSVTWWRGDRMLPLTSELFEQRRDFSLLIRSITLRNLGPYTCQAYNGLGKAASWSITVQSVGPVYTSNPEDLPYIQYLVTQPRRPENETAVVPEPQRPSYPYRPVRPPPEPPVVVQPQPQPEYQPEPPPAQVEPEEGEVPQPPETPRVFIAAVVAKITIDKTNYAVGSDISIPCAVEGYPIPRVSWYKDERLIEPNERLQISESHRLLIVRAETGDMGTYRCEAANQYGSSTSSISIMVEGVYIHPNCTDNPFFANCQLIVQAQYCTHKYYARFCCKSCTQAGQLPSHGPHLDKTGTLDRPPARK